MDVESTLVSPPRQRRSQRAWARILDAGEEILATDGLEGFTIGAICDRAGVSSAAIYARVPGKDSLFLAVYDHVLSHMAREREQFVGLAQTGEVSLEELIRSTVSTIAELFLRRAGFVRSVVWLSSTNDEVKRRGSEWMTKLGQEFTELIGEREEWGSATMARELDTCYRVVWSTIAIYLTHGGSYASERPLNDEEFVEELCDLAVRYLLSENEQR